MENISLIQFCVASALIVFGWFVLHQLSLSRNLKNKKTEIKTSYLIEAYRNLEKISNRENADISILESAIADIQLFGSEKQVEMAKNIAHSFAKDGEVLFDNLLVDLRKDLRRSLSLETLKSDNIVFLRYRSAN